MRIHYKRLCFTQKPPRRIPITNLPTKTRKINPGSNGRLCRLESPQSDENMELVLPRINGCKVVIIRIYNESLLMMCLLEFLYSSLVNKRNKQIIHINVHMLLCIFVYLCICVFVYLCICVFVYFCICVFVWRFDIGDLILILFVPPPSTTVCWLLALLSDRPILSNNILRNLGHSFSPICIYF